MTLEHYDTHPLRYHVAKRLDLNDVPDALWNKPVTRWHVQLWVEARSTADKGTVQDRLVELVREDLRAVKDLGGDITAWITPQRKGHVSTEANLSPDEPISLRASALCVYWAKLAEANRDVRRFRTKVLGGTVISTDDAARLLTSPATALVGAESFARHGVPIVGHTAELDVSERSKPFERPYRIRGSLRIEWPTGQATLPVANKGSSPPEPMEVWNGAKLTFVAPWSLSVLGELRRVASKLIERYPWEGAASAWFVLTGEPPWVPPLTATGSGPDLVKNHGTITIKAAHWVPEEAVSRLYSEMKAKMWSAPTTSLRRLTLFRFVAERSSGVNRWEPEGGHVQGLETPPWRSLLTLWNEIHPPGHEWHYHDVRNFRRDFAEASKSLLGY